MNDQIQGHNMSLKDPNITSIHYPIEFLHSPTQSSSQNLSKERFSSRTAQEYTMEDMHQSSTRSELLKSWAEISQLRDEKEVVVQQNMDLVCELDASRKREEELKRRLARYEGDGENEQSGLRGFLNRSSSQSRGPRDIRRRQSSGSVSVCSAKSSGTNATSSISIASSPAKLIGAKIEMSGMSAPPPRPGGLRKESSRRMSWGNNKQASIAEAENERLVEDFAMQIETLERENQEIIAALELKVNCRDAVLQSMERTQKADSDTLQRLRESLKKRDGRSQRREAELIDQINLLKSKLKEKRQQVAELRSKLETNKAYVEALTSKVERIVSSHRSGKPGRAPSAPPPRRKNSRATAG